jgi:molecular chaperone DnaK
MMSATIDFGIDLGTTNSSVACCRAGQVRVFQNLELSAVTPSVVYVAKSGRMLVGRKAYDTWVQDPQNTQAEFKRWMGFSDTLKFPASGRSMSAEELSAEVLKALRADATRQSGEPIDAAVITVPAAFGSLQCEATGRAAKAAGFVQAPLLQEPIAAAVAYGAGPSSRNQRWMVFDLGGGTLDIAIVSTRHERLAVLEHQGDNRLGGKDMDRVIAEQLLLPRLRAEFNLPDRKENPEHYDRFMRGLVRNAEHAKIALSTSAEALVELFDLGEDRDGKPIEAPITITRGELEAAVQPLIERCLELARRSLDGARIAKEDLDRILLVGGPTQMPVLRAALGSGIGVRLDWSIDSMTVVSQGAALYASTLEKTTASAAAPSNTKAEAAAASKGVAIKLSYERASGTMQSPVAGVVPGNSGVHEIKIDAEGGFWTSGWTKPHKGAFAVDVSLRDKTPVTRFLISARSAKGDAIAVTPREFFITYMLPMAAPPLPHTIAVEISDADGDLSFDPIFKRHCPLPAEASRTYRAERTLRPSDTEATLPIKFWEIEVSEDPQEKWWSGCVHVKASKIRRPIPEGTEIELTIKIDQSRKLTVEVFVPLLNETFVDDVFVPDLPSAKSQLQQQFELCFARIDSVLREIYEADRDDLMERARGLQLRLEAIYEQAAEAERQGHSDPDAAAGPIDQLRKIRIQLAQLEEQTESTRGQSTLARKVAADARWTSSLVEADGTDLEKEECRRLQEQLKKYADADDTRGLNWVREQLIPLRVSVRDRQPWFWQHLLHWYAQPGRRFLNKAQADIWLAKGQKAAAEQNFPAMREAAIAIDRLLTPDQVEIAKEQAVQSGLRSV